MISQITAVVSNVSPCGIDIIEVEKGYKLESPWKASSGYRNSALVSRS